MKPLKDFTIQFIGLKIGKHHFEYGINKTFFENFEFDEFNDASLNVNVGLNKKATLLELHFAVTGFVNLHCDTTNERYNQHIENSFDLVVKFGDTFNDDNDQILIVPHGEYEVNIAQYIYELIVLSIPTKRIHPGIEDGTLDSEILKRLDDLSPKGLGEKTNDEDIDPRWNTLKKLLTDK